MSLKSDDSQALKPIDLVLILAIAGRIDAQCRIFAQELDKSRYVYYAYAALDSLSSSYSMFKYFFDVFIPNSNNDMMHDMMMTPGGIIAVTAETLFLVTFSVLAAKFDGETEDNYKKFIATAWPYFRDVIKGLKNAYKGWRSAVVAASLIGDVDINYLIAPIGLALGIFAAGNRFWVRYMVTEPRKAMMIANGLLRSEIKKLYIMTEKESKYYLSQIKYQSEQIRSLAFLSVGAGGLIDGLYLYVGVLGLVALSPQMFAAMVVICAFYTVACVITRIYEEYDFQIKLIILQTKCKLDIWSKEIETAYSKLLSLQEMENPSEDDLYERRILKARIFSLLEQFDIHRKLLKKQSNRTYYNAVLLGLKNGLYAYGALASILFLVASILTMSGVAFPPLLLIISVSVGLAIIASFIIHSLVANYYHIQQENAKNARPYNQLVDLKNRMRLNLDFDDLPEKDSFNRSLADGLAVDPSPQYFFQEWFEVVRSVFSGFGKGQKFVDFAGNALQEADDMGHYHDTPFMYVLALFSAIGFGVILGLRALARGLGRPPLGQDQTVNNGGQEQLKSPSDPSVASVKDSEQQPSQSMEVTITTSDDSSTEEHKGVTGELLQTPLTGESLQTTQNWTDSLSNRTFFGFFETKKPAQEIKTSHSKSHDATQFPRSRSEVSLATSAIPDDTILGLG